MGRLVDDEVRRTALASDRNYFVLDALEHPENVIEVVVDPDNQMSDLVARSARWCVVDRDVYRVVALTPNEHFVPLLPTARVHLDTSFSGAANRPWSVA